jgi:hypothetical protein
MALNTTPGDPAADSYATLAEADAYHLARGVTTWMGADTLKEAALRRAVQWLEGRYRARWPGIRTNGRAQARDWPRLDAVDSEGIPLSTSEIPIEVKNAQIEAALRELVTPGSLLPDYLAAQRVLSETVGPISTTFADAPGLGASQPDLPAVEGILGPIIGARSDGVILLERA